MRGLSEKVLAMSREANSCNDDETQKEVVDVSKLPKIKSWLTNLSDSNTLYQGCWFLSSIVPNVVAFQQQFQAHHQDIILATNPKSGTTWLKALLFSITNRNRYTRFDTPLLTSNPHDLVPHLESDIFSKHPVFELTKLPSPRLLTTHIPCSSLPDSVLKHSKCKIVYICRNPLDTITSFWLFAEKNRPVCPETPEWGIEKYVECFCKGETEFGPFWEHVLGFWKASLEKPEKVMFLMYEDMLEDTVSQVKRLAEFVGFPFSEEETNRGVIKEIVELCSLRNLKELDVNKHGKIVLGFETNVFFRKGKVGDWINHLSPNLVESVNRVIQEKFHGSGLTFKYFTI